MKSRSQGLLFALAKQKEGFEQGGSRRSLRKKTVRWIVFADGVKERSDAKVHKSAPKKSLTLRQNEKQVARPAFCFAKQKEGFEQGGSRRSLRKETVRWTVFADGVKERSDAKVHGSAPKKSLTLRQNEKQVARPAFCFGKTKRGIRTRREQTQSAEENSPVDCFCRRGQGAKRREGARECTEKIPNSPPRSAVVHDTMGYRTFLFFCRESPHWNNTKSIRDAKQDYIFC